MSSGHRALLEEEASVIGQTAAAAPAGCGKGGASGVSQTQALLLPGAPFLKAYG